MTQFVRSEFQFHGGYLTYGPNHKFVARFKYRGGDRAGFTTFLIKNFHVEEYFGMMDFDKMSPVEILKTKGYMSKTVKDNLKMAGFPATQDGLKDYLEAQRAAYQKRVEAVL